MKPLGPVTSSAVASPARTLAPNQAEPSSSLPLAEAGGIALQQSGVAGDAADTDAAVPTLAEFYKEMTHLSPADQAEMESDPKSRALYKDVVGALQFALWAKKHEFCTVEDCVVNQVDECVRLDWILEKVKEKFA